MVEEYILLKTAQDCNKFGQAEYYGYRTSL